MDLGLGLRQLLLEVGGILLSLGALDLRGLARDHVRLCRGPHPPPQRRNLFQRLWIRARNLLSLSRRLRLGRGTRAQLEPQKTCVAFSLCSGLDNAKTRALPMATCASAVAHTSRRSAATCFSVY